MSNNINREQRKPTKDEFVAGKAVKDLTVDVAKVVNNEKYISKRQKYIIGNRTLDNALNAHETLRRANSIFVDNNINLSKKRVELAQQAYDLVQNTCADISLFPELLNFPEDHPEAISNIPVINQEKIENLKKPEKPFKYVNYRDPKKEDRAFVKGMKDAAKKSLLLYKDERHKEQYKFSRWYAELSKTSANTEIKMRYWVKGEEKRHRELVRSVKNKQNNTENKTN